MALKFLYQIDREHSTESTAIVEFAFGPTVKKLLVKYIGTFLKTRVLHIRLWFFFICYKNKPQKQIRTTQSDSKEHFIKLS